MASLRSRSDQNELLTSLLREVSRSFYLTLRVLPGPVRAPVGLAYLLARATDTIADTDVFPVTGRLQALAALRRRILETAAGRDSDRGTDDFSALAGRQALPAERRLLERVADALAVLTSFEPADRQRIADVLMVITSGQELDLQRFADAAEDRIVALASEAELDDYTYRVAGCVGAFWTRMCVAHLFPAPPDPDGKNDAGGADEAGWFERSGVEFGKGLQLVNILRDLPRDLRQGRCYLPRASLAQAGLEPADLLQPSNEGRLRPVYDALLGRAGAFLRNGARYTAAIPRDQVRMRLACALPIRIGIRTLAALRQGPVLEPARRIKVSRPEVRAILVRTMVALPFPGAWRRWLIEG